MSGAVLAVAFVAVAAGLGAWWGWLVRWKSVKATRDNPLGRRFAVQIALLATSYAVAFACVCLREVEIGSSFRSWQRGFFWFSASAAGCERNCARPDLRQ